MNRCVLETARHSFMWFFPNFAWTMCSVCLCMVEALCYYYYRIFVVIVVVGCSIYCENDENSFWIGFFLLCFLLISLFLVAACCYMIPKNLCRLMRAEIVFIFIFISCSASRFHFIFIIPNNSNEIDFSFELSTYDSNTQLAYMYQVYYIKKILF